MSNSIDKEAEPTLPPTSPQGSPSSDLVPAYSRAFWYAYGANLTLCTANSLMFRYADLVTQLGGDAKDLGWIVGLGTIGSLVTRFFLGKTIDTYGARATWSISISAYILSLLAHLLLTSAVTWPIYVVRLAFSTAAAGAFGAQLTFVSLSSPERRLAEVIGSLGTAGFLGLLLGPFIGDLISGPNPGSAEVHRIIVAAALLSGVSLFCSLQSTRDEAAPQPNEGVGVKFLLSNHWPGMILVASSAMGLGIGLFQTFVRPFTESLGITNISVFFGAYALSGFGVRLMIRRLPALFGNPPLILVGFGFMITAILTMPWVSSQWHLLLPAVLVGSSHAFVFPTIMAQGAVAFPARYRGFASTVMLGTMDFGVFVSSPAFGWIVDEAKHFHLPPYPTMFVVAAFAVLATSGLYAWEWLSAYGKEENAPDKGFANEQALVGAIGANGTPLNPTSIPCDDALSPIAHPEAVETLAVVPDA